MRRKPLGVAVISSLALCLWPAQGLAAGPSGPAERVFAALYSRGPAWIDGKTPFEQPAIGEHIEHHEALGARLIGAAPFSQQEDDPLVGMILIFAATRKEAVEWADADPAVVKGVMTVQVYEWTVDTLMGCFSGAER